jgi:hypothetical protein
VGAQRVAQIAADAHITAVDQVSVSTPQEAIKALASRLDQGGSARLTVSAAGTVETIVLKSDSGQGAANSLQRRPEIGPEAE